MPSFETDICPLFREIDVRAMARFFDLTSYEDVKANSAIIWERVELGNMPCDEMWPDDRVQLLREWIDEGMAP
jgi:hypothetical protein